MNEHLSHQPIQEQDTASDYASYPMDWARRFVTVERNPNPETGEPARLEDGWIVDGETHDGEKFVVVKLNEDGTSLEKRISKDKLNELQNRLFQERQAKREAAETPADRMKRRLGDTAAAVTMPPRATEPLPQTLEERVAAGWAVPRSELIAAGIIPAGPKSDK